MERGGDLAIAEGFQTAHACTLIQGVPVERTKATVVQVQLNSL